MRYAVHDAIELGFKCTGVHPNGCWGTTMTWIRLIEYAIAFDNNILNRDQA